MLIRRLLTLESWSLKRMGEKEYAVIMIVEEIYAKKHSV